MLTSDDIKLIMDLDKYDYSIIFYLESLFTDNKINRKKSKELIDFALENWTNPDRINDVITYAQCTGQIDRLLNNKKHYNTIITYADSLVSLKNSVKYNKGTYYKVMAEIKRDLNNFTSQIVDYVIKAYHLNNDIDKYKLNTFKKIFFMLLNDIALNENQKLNNLEYVGMGDVACVYSLGNKIIKIGEKRISATFPNNPYIIKPLLRKEFSIGDNNIIMLEVCEKGLERCCSSEDVYNLFKCLRDLHLVWMDPSIRNAGKLIKDNNVYWRFPLHLTDEELMFEAMRGDKILKAGEAIILDADAIYDEKDKRVNFQRVAQFELRYKKMTK